MAAIAGAAADAKEEKPAFTIAQLDKLVAERLDILRRDAPRRFAHFVEELFGVAHGTLSYDPDAGVLAPFPSSSIVRGRTSELRRWLAGNGVLLEILRRPCQYWGLESGTLGGFSDFYS
jgi:hypothetical protein